MSTAITQLTPDILDRFAAALRLAGAPLGNQIQRGLTDAQVDQLGTELGISVPAELRTLWRWGVPAAKLANDNWDVNPEFELWPPARVAEETQLYRRNPTASRTSIAFAGPPGDGHLVAGGHGATSEVIYSFIEDPDTLVVAPSLGALFDHWADLLANGNYRYVDSRWQPFEDGPSTLPRRS